MEHQANLNIELEEKVYKSNRISIDLMKDIEEEKIRNNALENQFGYYIPVKSDLVDVKLGEFINLSSERPELKALFVRESQGEYLFGSKKINIRTENGLLKVRVGGGWLTLDEFVDEHLATEFAKTSTMRRYIEHNDPRAKPYIPRVKSRSPKSRSSSPNIRHRSSEKRRNVQFKDWNRY